MRSRLAALSAIPALALVAVAVWEILATRTSAAEVPGDDVWARAASEVRRAHRPGDLIVISPAWADPIGRLHLGDLIPLEMAGRMDAARYGRIWELAVDGHARAPHPDVAGLAPAEERDVGGITVRRFEREPAVVVTDLADVLPTARVEGGSARVDLAEVAFEPHRCILAPTPAGRPVTLTFPRVALGRELVGYVGIADVFTRRDSREPVELTVEIGGLPIASAHAPIDRWVRFAAPTTPGPADVRVTLRWTPAGKATAPKQICFAAEARR